MMKRILITTIIAAGFLIFSYMTQPYEREFDTEDEAISRPHKAHDTITFKEVTALSLAIPIALLFGVFYINSIEKKDEISFYISFLSACLITSTVVENLKNLFGRLRPDFLDRCKPILGKCTGDPDVVLEGRKSFPSGHTSVATCGFIFLTLFICKEFRLPNLRRKGGRTLVLPLCLVSLIIPIVVGASRVVDNRHFISDVVIGGAIGAIVGILEFRYLEKTIVPRRYGVMHNEMLTLNSA